MAHVLLDGNRQSTKMVPTQTQMHLFKHKSRVVMGKCRAPECVARPLSATSIHGITWSTTTWSISPTPWMPSNDGWFPLFTGHFRVRLVHVVLVPSGQILGPTPSKATLRLALVGAQQRENAARPQALYCRKWHQNQKKKHLPTPQKT